MLGDLIPVLTGVAMAGPYLGQKIVAMTWIGDGGSSTGVFHEGLNLAASQKAAFVLILENNQWAYSTPVRRQVPLENLADRAKAYGISSYIVDGNDPVVVYATAKEAAYCAGDDCHKIRPKWERPIAEVTPPKSSVEPVWLVEGFGRGKTSSRENAPIHFGDTQPANEEPAAKTKPPAKPTTKPPARKSAPAKSAARGKARR